MSVITGLCRVFIVVVNIFFLIIGLVFFGLGMFLRFGSAIINEYLDTVKQQLEASATDSGVGALDLSNFDITELLFGLALGLIFFGLFLIIITIFGCCGGCCKIKWMLIAYVVVCGILLIGQIIVIGILYGSPDTFHDPAKQKLKDQIQSDYAGLTGTDVVSMGWNVIMQQMKCCGVESYQDFTGATKWTIDYSSVGTGYTLETPLSCCKVLPTSDDLSCATSSATEADNYLNTGCYEEIWDLALGNQTIMIGVLVGIGVFQQPCVGILSWTRQHRMATRTKKYGSFVVVLLLVRAMLFAMEYTSVAQKKDVQSNFKNVPARCLNNGNASDGHVSNFYIINKTLKLHGIFKGSNFKQNKTHTMLTGWPETFENDSRQSIRQEDKLELLTLPKQHYFNRDRRVKNVNCQAMIKGYKNEIARADTLSKMVPKVPYSAEFYINLTSNCSDFIHERGYIMDPLTDAERDFPVAFSLLMYRDVEQSERLFRAIYRPQNWYCFHVDSKTKESIHRAMSNIADCFENVFILEKRYNVTWGTMTVLEPEIHCMEELWKKSKTWKYFINLTGQEFPLRTNYELVQILQAYNGSNDIGATVERANKIRWIKAGTPPHGIVPAKGPVHITASRGFVDFVLHDPRSKDFLQWTNKTTVSDETFFASLNYNLFLGVPGSYKGSRESNISGDIKQFASRFKNWCQGKYCRSCKGKIVRNICVFGTGDLPRLASGRQLFANKFYLDYKHYTLDCIEEWYFNHTRDEYLGELQFDARWYAQLGFVSNTNDQRVNDVNTLAVSI